MTIHTNRAHEQTPDKTSRFDLFVSSVQAATGRQGRPSGPETIFLCPAHEDRNPSLSAREGDDGRVLAYCHAGCSFEEICKAIDHAPTEFGPTDADDPGEWTPAGPADIVYDYTDEAGNLLFQVCRTTDKQFPQRRPDPTSASGWRWNLDGVPRVLYRLPELVAAVTAGATVYVCEGEKDVDAARALGLVATCNPGGAGKWRKEYSDVLAGAEVVLVADADAPGRRHTAAVREALADVAANVTALEPAVGKDLSDHLAAGHALDELVPLQEPAAAERKQKQRANKDVLIETVLTDAEFFHSPAQEAFASFRAGDHRETWPLKSGRFATWLSHTAYNRLGIALSQTLLADSLRLLEAVALFDGPSFEVYTRLAPYGDGICLDLADDAWRAIVVTAAGWQVVADPPVRFRRTNATMPLPEPQGGGQIDELRRFVNVSDDGWVLFSSWLIGALRPTGPYPILDLVGEQGSAKSTTARIARQLIDPHKAPLQSAPREGRDLMIAANYTWLLAYDNLSGVRDWLSDAFCRISTGGGFATRQLYTDTEEIVLDAQRPLILTGIGDHSTRSDLLDRELLVTLPPISENKRRPEREFWAEFEEARPTILGSLLDILVHVLGHEKAVELEGHPRMADFAVCAAAAAPALGWTEERFMAIYSGNRADLHAVALDDAPIASAVLTLAERNFEGTASDLLDKLASLDEAASKRHGWPRNGGSLSGQLRRLAPNFRANGVEILWQRETTGKKRKLIVIRRTDAAAATENPGENAACSSPAGVTRVTEPSRPARDDVRGDAGDGGGAGGATSDSASTDPTLEHPDLPANPPPGQKRQRRFNAPRGRAAATPTQSKANEHEDQK